ncbi:MAG TPA: CDP-glucose 4,6-dehydratase [Burkholderiales bacterium]
MNPDFWKGKRVFLTGHTGFKGAWLSLWLSQSGAKVTGFSIDVPTRPSFFEVANVAGGMHDVRGDVCDLEALHAQMQQAAPEIVLHMAAQSLVRESYVSPVRTYATNVMGTVNVLDAVRRLPSVRAVVVVTSDKCYENREWSRGYKESDPMGGRDPYSNSKACAELVTAAYRSSFFDAEAAGAVVASARAGNVIGGGDWAADRLVPDAMRAFPLGRPLEIRNPKAVRPWQHVLEPLSGYLLLAERLFSEGRRWAGGWNFGPLDEDARPVEYVVEQLTRCWGDGARWSAPAGTHPHEAGLLMLDCTKARRELGWQPKWRLEQALDAVVAWHRAFSSGMDMQSFSLRQIEDYAR